MAYKNLRLSDLHIHTNYAYCSENVTPEENILKAKEKGLQRIAFTEHSGQLYVSSKDYWSARFINEPDLIQQNRNSDLNRMKKYREEMKNFRSPSVLIGLEVEVDCSGNLVILKEDLKGWDILIGAVHYLPQRFEVGSKEGFMWANEALLRKGVNILAHPFRYFIRNKLQVPTELYKPLAELLAQYNAAIELNYHTNNNDPEFFRICAEHNVPISLGSDAHNLDEIGSFDKHLELLESICPLDEQSDLLYI
jgi:histidinol phosphatase-like PHP family hydrolase